MSTYLNQTALQILSSKGKAYRKKPGLDGFHVFHSSNPNYRVHNRLEDIEYHGEGYYLIGLLGEIWKVSSFAKLTTSYVLDAPGEDREITEELIANTSSPVGNDYTQCLAIRYRDVQTSFILAARAPLNVKSIAFETDPGKYEPMYVNASTCADGRPIQHGEGDMIACALVECKSEHNDSLHVVCGRPYAPDYSSVYVINGEVFPI